MLSIAELQEKQGELIKENKNTKQEICDLKEEKKKKKMNINDLREDIKYMYRNIHRKM